MLALLCACQLRRLVFEVGSWVCWFRLTVNGEEDERDDQPGGGCFLACSL